MNELMTAVARNDADSARKLLQAGSNPDARDSDGRTSLMHAALDGKKELIDLLIGHGADVNAQDKNGFSPLHFAAQDFRIAAAETLLQAKANVDSQDKYGNTPLWRAVFNSKGRGEMIRLLLSHRANPLVKNHSGKSPVDLAAIIANYDIKQFFT